MQTLKDLPVDIVALDAESEIVAVVEVQTMRQMDRAAKKQVLGYLKRFGTLVPYVILVDPEWICIYGWDGEALSDALVQLPTADVLTRYDPDFSASSVYHAYLETLVEAWLRDVAYRWKSETPPAYEELAAIRLAQRLQNGTTIPEPAKAP